MRARLAIGVACLLITAGCSGGSEEAAAPPVDELPPATTAPATATDTESATLPSAETTPETQAATTAPPAEPEEDPGDFYRRLYEYLSNGQYGRMWELLHPVHQEAAPRSRLLDCYEQVGGLTGELQDVEIVEVYDEPVLVPGTNAEVPSKAVTTKVTFSAGGEEFTETDTSHAIPLNGEWVWILSPPAYRAFKAGSCPTQ
jgi:hypothetical protein